MKQGEQTELLRTQQMLNETNRELLMILRVAEVLPWKWELVGRMVWFDACPLGDPEGWEIIHNDLFPASITRVYKGIHKEDRFRVIGACRELLNGKVRKVVIELRFWAKKKGGLVLGWLEMHTISGKYDGNGKLLMVKGSLMSTSKRKALEEGLTAVKERMGEANRLKSALIVNMNYEMCTPSNVIVGFASPLSIVDDEKERQEYIGSIRSNTEHLLWLMNDVIDFSNTESGVTDMVGSNALPNPLMEKIEQIYRPKAELRNLVLAWGGEQLGVHIYTDRGRLIQALEHLLCNAIKFTLKGTVRLGYRKGGEGRTWFYVMDIGCGIPEEKKELIFERFVELDGFVQGLGLGLPLCRVIVDRLHGIIEVDSKVGGESTFWFTLSDLSGKLIQDLRMRGREVP